MCSEIPANCVKEGVGSGEMSYNGCVLGHLDGGELKNFDNVRGDELGLLWVRAAS